MNRNKLFYFIGMFLCWICFGLSLYYADQLPLLVLTGMASFGGMCYFTFLLVFKGDKNRSSDR